MSKISNDFSHFLNPQIKHDKSKKSKNNDKSKSIIKKDSFQDLFVETEATSQLDAQQETEEKKIEQMLKQIGIQGELLKKRKLLTDLDKYKKMINEYLTHVISLFETSENKVIWDSRRKEKISKTHLTIIDKELADLTKIFFMEQQNTLAIAAKIDKIEGLMINLLS